MYIDAYIYVSLLPQPPQTITGRLYEPSISLVFSVDGGYMGSGEVYGRVLVRVDRPSASLGVLCHWSVMKSEAPRLQVVC